MLKTAKAARCHTRPFAVDTANMPPLYAHAHAPHHLPSGTLPDLLPLKKLDVLAAGDNQLTGMLPHMAYFQVGVGHLPHLNAYASKR